MAKVIKILLVVSLVALLVLNLWIVAGVIAAIYATVVVFNYSNQKPGEENVYEAFIDTNEDFFIETKVGAPAIAKRLNASYDVAAAGFKAAKAKQELDYQKAGTSRTGVLKDKLKTRRETYDSLFKDYDKSLEESMKGYQKELDELSKLQASLNKHK